MADYIYLLEHRLSSAQRASLRGLREVARQKSLTIFLAGGAVRDLTSGSPVRDLDVVVQGNALKLRKDIEKIGGVITGESDAIQSLYVNFPGNVRVEVGSTISLTFPKPGKAVARPATILEDLRRRDFTVNAMALSLNDGSYGLLMDPLNGVADIENRQLRLVSNYGFIEDPVRMIRAARLSARLGWMMDEKTQARYDTGKQEGYIGAMSEFHRGYETEEIVHEEDPLRVMKRLEAEGWMQFLAPYWTSAKVNVPELERLRGVQTQLQMQGIHPNTSAAHFPLLTAKLSPKELQTLKESFPRQGFVVEIERLESDARDFTSQLTGKGASLPSQAWKLITAGSPEAVLWTAFSTKSSPLQAKFKSFGSEWPLARQKMPYVMMQEMRIVPEVADYDALLEKLFFEIMDGKLQTPEEMKAFLEPYSPPAPPPPVNMRRPRAAKKEAKVTKPRVKKANKAEAVPAELAIEAPSSSATQVAEQAAATPLVSPARKKEPKATPERPVASKAATNSVPAKAAALKKSPAAAKPVPPKKASVTKAALVKQAAGKLTAPASAKTEAKASAKSLAVKPKSTAPTKKAKPTTKTSPKTKASQGQVAKKAFAKKSSGKAAPKNRLSFAPSKRKKVVQAAPPRSKAKAHPAKALKAPSKTMSAVTKASGKSASKAAKKIASKRR